MTWSSRGECSWVCASTNRKVGTAPHRQMQMCLSILDSCDAVHATNHRRFLFQVSICFWKAPWRGPNGRSGQRYPDPYWSISRKKPTWTILKGTTWACWLPWPWSLAWVNGALINRTPSWDHLQPVQISRRACQWPAAQHRSPASVPLPLVFLGRTAADSDGPATLLSLTLVPKNA